MVITYAGGAEALPGDRVNLDSLRGVVEAVIESEAGLANWGIDEPGLMIKTDDCGLMYEPVDSITRDAVILLERGDS